jgi:hypothetical protein
MANLAKMTLIPLYKLDSNKMNLISTLFDRIHFIFLQFTETINYISQIDRSTDYTQLLPPSPERVLVYNYNLPPPYAISILRGSLKPIFLLTNDEFKQQVHIFKSILDMHLEKRTEAAAAEEENNFYFDERTYI